MNAVLSRRSLISHRQREKNEILRILHRPIVGCRFHCQRCHLIITILILCVRIGAVVNALQAREAGVVQHFVHDDAGLVVWALPIAWDAKVGGARGVADGEGPGGGILVGTERHIAAGVADRGRVVVRVRVVVAVGGRFGVDVAVPGAPLL